MSNKSKTLEKALTSSKTNFLFKGKRNCHWIYFAFK